MNRAGLARENLGDFVHCYKIRKQTDRFRRFPIEDLLKRDKLHRTGVVQRALALALDVRSVSNARYTT